MAERGVSVEASPRTTDNFAKSAKGELGPPPWRAVFVGCGRRRLHRHLAGGSIFWAIRWASPSMQYASSRPVDDVGMSCPSRAQRVWSEVAWRVLQGYCGHSLPSGHGTSVCTRRRRSGTPATPRRTSMFSHGSHGSVKSRAWLASRRGEGDREGDGLDIS